MNPTLYARAPQLLFQLRPSRCASADLRTIYNRPSSTSSGPEHRRAWRRSWLFLATGSQLRSHNPSTGVTILVPLVEYAAAGTTKWGAVSLGPPSTKSRCPRRLRGGPLERPRGGNLSRRLFRPWARSVASPTCRALLCWLALPPSLERRIARRQVACS